MVPSTITVNEALIHERDTEIQGIMEDVTELNGLFHDVSLLVAEQGGRVNLIDDNISRSRRYTERTRRDLWRARVDQRRRRTMCCIL